MKRLLLDVNIALDLVLARPPFSTEAAALWGAAETGRVEIVLPAHGVTTVYYLAARAKGNAFAARVVEDLLVVPAVAGVDGRVLRRALALGWPDFEDAVCAAAAEAAACDFLVTRDPKGYRDSPVTVVEPGTALALIAGESGTGEVRERAAAGRRRRSQPRMPARSGG